MALQVAISPSYIDADGSMDPKLATLETLDSFAQFCKHIGASDSLYWQKIYTRLNLPYDKTCPRGNEPLRLD
jgi:hypothetical protein